MYYLFARKYNTPNVFLLAVSEDVINMTAQRLQAMEDPTYCNQCVVSTDPEMGETYEDAKDEYILVMNERHWNNILDQQNTENVAFHGG